MKRVKYFLIKTMSYTVLMCTYLSVSQCCLGKIYQGEESKEFRQKVRHKIKKINKNFISDF